MMSSLTVDNIMAGRTLPEMPNLRSPSPMANSASGAAMEASASTKRPASAGNGKPRKRQTRPDRMPMGTDSRSIAFARATSSAAAPPSVASAASSPGDSGSKVRAPCVATR